VARFLNIAIRYNFSCRSSQKVVRLQRKLLLTITISFCIIWSMERPIPGEQPKPDHYQVLGVARNADRDGIKTAYRKLARELHPDVNRDPKAEVRFKQVTEAYDTLSNPEQRANYNFMTPPSPHREEPESRSTNYGTQESRPTDNPENRYRDDYEGTVQLLDLIIEASLNKEHVRKAYRRLKGKYFY
jgi:DnaJ-domain-containing protein 1